MRPRNTVLTLVFGALTGVLLALFAIQSVTVAAAPDRRAEELILQGNVIAPDVLEYGKR